NPIGYALHRLVCEGNAKRPLHIGDCSGELDGSASRCWRASLHGQAKLLSEALNKLHSGGFCRMVIIELSTSQALFACDMCSLERRLAPNNDRYGETSVQWRRLFAVRPRERFFLAAGQYGPALGGEVRNGFLQCHFAPPKGR